MNFRCFYTFGPAVLVADLIFSFLKYLMEVVQMADIYVMLYFVQYNKISLNSTSLHGRVWIFSAQNDYKTHWNFILTLIATKMIYRNQNLATVLFYQHSMYFANTETTVTIMASWKWLLFCICFKTIGGYNRHKAGQLSFKVHEIRSTIDVLT